MRIVHVRAYALFTGLNEDERRVAEPKFGMLRLAFGELGARSSACEVPSLPEWIGASESNNGDQEV